MYYGIKQEIFCHGQRNIPSRRGTPQKIHFLASKQFLQTADIKIQYLVYKAIYIYTGVYTGCLKKNIQHFRLRKKRYRKMSKKPSVDIITQDFSVQTHVFYLSLLSLTG